MFSEISWTRFLGKVHGNRQSHVVGNFNKGLRQKILNPSVRRVRCKCAIRLSIQRSRVFLPVLQHNPASYPA